jgi:hypothetical protein
MFITNHPIKFSPESCIYFHPWNKDCIELVVAEPSKPSVVVQMAAKDVEQVVVLLLEMLAKRREAAIPILPPGAEGAPIAPFERPTIKSRLFNSCVNCEEYFIMGPTPEQSDFCCSHCFHQENGDKCPEACRYCDDNRAL